MDHRIESPLGRQGLAWPAGLDLRCRAESDTDALFRLLSANDFQRNGATIDPFDTVEDAADFFAAMPAHAFETVACLDAEVVGYASVLPASGRQRHTGTITLCVDAAHQRRGIGAMLLSTLISTAWVMMELSRLQLTVFVDNERAIALYRRFGFAQEGCIANFVQRLDGFVDAYLMALLKPNTLP